MRDSVRRDIEQALSALAFATTLHERLESQRRLFADFPRVTEQIRSGPFERVASALARLYEGKDQFDLSRFLRDLPLALAQLAASEARRSAPPPPAEKGAPRTSESPSAPAGDSTGAPAGVAESGQAQSAPAADASLSAESSGASASAALPGAADSGAASAPSGVGGEPPPSDTAGAERAAESAAPAQAAEGTSASAPPAPGAEGTSASAALAGASQAGAGEPPEPPSPRVELRTRMLAAVPQLARAVLTYRRTVATVRRAAAPRRAPGPWRSDREVLEEAQRALEFAQQMFDAYAEAWADQPVQPNIAESMSAEADRFLAWTQLSRYVDLAGRGAAQGPAAPASGPAPETAAPPKPEGQAASSPVTQGSPGAGGAAASESGV